MLRGLGPMLVRSASLRRALWKGWYEFAAKRLKQDQWTFMNYGYASTDDTGETLPLEPADEENRWSIQIYARAIGGLDLDGRDVLEVGSGRGGGAAFIARYHGPRSVVGVDFAAHAVTLSRRLHGDVPRLTFLRGDAEALPLPDASFDVLVNVESSHCYGSMERFLAEATRVLRPAGHLLWVDMRAPADRPIVRAQFAAAGLDVVEEEDITPNVVAALDRVSARNTVMVEHHVPKFLAATFENFAGMPGTRTYESLRSGRVSYLRLMARKP